MRHAHEGFAQLPPMQEDLCECEANSLADLIEARFRAPEAPQSNSLSNASSYCSGPTLAKSESFQTPTHMLPISRYGFRDMEFFKLKILAIYKSKVRFCRMNRKIAY